MTWTRLSEGTDERVARPEYWGQRPRHRSRRELKTLQLNMRIRPSFKPIIERMAVERGISIVELVELAVAEMANRDATRPKKPDPSPNWDWLVQ